MLDNAQFRALIVRPTLEIIGLYSQEAEDLLVMTMAHESKGGTYIKQKGGPALGIYQMEHRTFEDIYSRILKKSPLMCESISLACGMNATRLDDHEDLVGNLYFATAIARIYYTQFNEPIPKDINSLSLYAKKFWNRTGKATPEQYLRAYLEFNHIKASSI